MENKLQELTSKIYAEGVDKAKKEADKIIAEAKSEVESMQKKAKKEAAKIIEDARKESEELKKNVTSEVKLSVRQAINKIKQEITGLITAKAAKEDVGNAFADKDFVKEIIVTAVKNWNPADSEGIDAAILLPEKDQKELTEYFSARQKSLLDAGLVLNFDDSLDAGFKIGPKDGSYQISFTEEDFESFFTNYMRPRTIELLYSAE